jgi:hypothetical protein
MKEKKRIFEIVYILNINNSRFESKTKKQVSLTDLWMKIDRLG